MPRVCVLCNRPALSSVVQKCAWATCVENMIHSSDLFLIYLRKIKSATMKSALADVLAPNKLTSGHGVVGDVGIQECFDV